MDGCKFFCVIVLSGLATQSVLITAQVVESTTALAADIECFSCVHHAQNSPSQDCLDRIGITDVNLCTSGQYCMQYETTNNSKLVIAGIGCGAEDPCAGTTEGSYNTLNLPGGLVMNFTCCSTDYCNCPHCDLPTLPPFDANVTGLPETGLECFLCSHTTGVPSQGCLDRIGAIESQFCDASFCMHYETKNGSGLQGAGLTCGDVSLCNGTADGVYQSMPIGADTFLNYTCCSSDFCNCPQCDKPAISTVPTMSAGNVDDSPAPTDTQPSSITTTTSSSTNIHANAVTSIFLTVVAGLHVCCDSAKIVYV